MTTSWRRVFQGLAFLVVLALLIGLTVVKFQRKFPFEGDEVAATLHVKRAGTQLNPNADVKIRGIVVGRVAGQRADGGGATLDLRLDRSKTKFIPDNVVARLLPKTLFGEKYVDLVIPNGSTSTGHVQAGATIPEDTSREAIEVERVLGDLFPLLRSLEPEKLNAALTAIAEGLRGRGNQLGQALANFNAYLVKINPKIPNIQYDISGLADLADSLNASAEDILTIARNSVVSGRTLVAKQQTYVDFLRGTAGFADQLTETFRRNGDDLIYLASATRQTLATVYPKKDELPGTVAGLNELLTKLNQALNHGPALSIRLEPIPTRGSYDTPCTYPAPDYSGGCTIGEGTVHPGGQGIPPFPGVSAAGAPGSPEERNAVRELLAPGLGVDPGAVPDLAVLLVSPVLRGTVVDAR